MYYVDYFGNPRFDRTFLQKSDKLRLYKKVCANSIRRKNRNMKQIKLGFAPTRRSIFSAPDAIKYRGLTADRLRELGIDFVDIDDINEEGLLYDENDQTASACGIPNAACLPLVKYCAVTEFLLLISQTAV